MTYEIKKSGFKSERHFSDIIKKYEGEYDVIIKKIKKECNDKSKRLKRFFQEKKQVEEQIKDTDPYEKAQFSYQWIRPKKAWDSIYGLSKDVFIFFDDGAESLFLINPIGKTGRRFSKELFLKKYTNELANEN